VDQRFISAASIASAFIALSLVKLIVRIKKWGFEKRFEHGIDGAVP
jgi:hypothetical protein